ncbi:protein eyes shut-like [Sycon ciliatum]|uniref:protein eyes shut-like n=1 Tax=Sycon ciliatum TaxID=27933 RepID=UPI0031F64EC7
MLEIPGVPADMPCLCPPGLNVPPPKGHDQNLKQKYLCSEHCTGDRYGHNCMHRCNCTRGVCNNRIGCVCPDGYMGINCDQKCAKNYYGPQCRKSCDCAEGCHPSTGVCNPCEDPRHGNGTVCVHCNCNSNPDELSVCIATQFECGCVAGYRRDNGICVPCQEGRYGKNCSKRCDCQHNEGCHPMTGICRHEGAASTTVEVTPATTLVSTPSYPGRGTNIISSASEVPPSTTNSRILTATLLQTQAPITSAERNGQPRQTLRQTVGYVTPAHPSYSAIISQSDGSNSISPGDEDALRTTDSNTGRTTLPEIAAPYSTTSSHSETAGATPNTNTTSNSEAADTWDPSSTLDRTSLLWLVGSFATCFLWALAVIAVLLVRSRCRRKGRRESKSSVYIASYGSPSTTSDTRTQGSVRSRDLNMEDRISAMWTSSDNGNVRMLSINSSESSLSTLHSPSFTDFSLSSGLSQSHHSLLERTCSASGSTNTVRSECSDLGDGTYSVAYSSALQGRQVKT